MSRVVLVRALQSTLLPDESLAFGQVFAAVCCFYLQSYTFIDNKAFLVVLY